eukprot:scaffold8928_cov105-Skeletonema_marinoi.AAC.1
MHGAVRYAIYAVTITKLELLRTNTRAALFAFGPRGPHAKGSARIYSTTIHTTISFNMRIKAALLSVSWFAHAASSSSVGDDITLHAGIMSLPPYAVLTNKTWSGYMFDLANLLMDNAETNHNVSLNIIMNASDPYYT